jgi:hypothetical protein
MPQDSGDRVLDWHQELLRVAPRLNELPVAARRALVDAVGSFLREDAVELAEELTRHPQTPLADAA